MVFWDWLGHVLDLECHTKFTASERGNTNNPWHAVPTAIIINFSPAVDYDEVLTQANVPHFLT